MDRRCKILLMGILTCMFIIFILIYCNWKDGAISYSLFLESIQNGNYAETEAILKKHPDFVNRKNKFGITPLHLAIYYGRLNIVKMLVEKGADKNKFVQTTCWFKFLNIPIYGDVIEVHRENNLAGSPLGLSILRNETEISKFLMDSGASLVIDDHYSNPLFFLGGADNFELVKYLISKGCDVNTRDSIGKTPVQQAALSGNPDIVRFLISQNADIFTRDSLGSSSLHYAAMGGDATIVRLLIDKNIDINLKDKCGRTALHDAIRPGNEQTIELLIKNGAEVNIGNDLENTPLHYAMSSGTFPIIKLLVENNADLNRKNNKGRTPLHKLIISGFSNPAEILGLGASDGNRIIKRKEDEICCIIEYMISNGAEINCQDNDARTPLHFATMLRSARIKKLLIELGADTTLKDKNGNTP